MEESGKRQIIIKIHLIISILIVVPAAIIYGFFPDLIIDVVPKTLDEHSFQKAVMGLYLGFSILWLVGVFKKQLLKTALFSNMVFMLGLGLGRLLSIFVDGIPSMPYLFGTFAELFLGFYGVWVIRHYWKDIH